MKRKLAFLLAFTMVISILPMNVFANVTAQQRGLVTGQLWDIALGPAQNVRHMSTGTIVSNRASVNQFVHNRNMSPNWERTPGGGLWRAHADAGAIVVNAAGNMRHITASLDYFSGFDRDNPIGSATADLGWVSPIIELRINNARGFLQPTFWGAPNEAELNAAHGAGWAGTGPAGNGFANVAYTGIRSGNPDWTGTPQAGSFAWELATNAFNLIGDLDLTQDELNQIILEAFLTEVANFLEDFRADDAEEAMIPFIDIATPPAVVVPPGSDTMLPPDFCVVGLPLPPSPSVQEVINALVVAATGLWETQADIYEDAIDAVNALIDLLEDAVAEFEAEDISEDELMEIYFDAVEWLYDNIPWLLWGNGGVDVVRSARNLAGVLALIELLEELVEDLLEDIAELDALEDHFTAVVPPATQPVGVTNVLVIIDQLTEIAVEPIDIAVRANQIADQLEDVIGNRDVLQVIPAWQGTNQGTFYVLLLPVMEGGLRNPELMEMILVRSHRNIELYNVPGRETPIVAVPIEFVTSGATNNNPVFLTFRHLGNWPQAGTTLRTDLTVAADNRFNLSLHEGHNQATAPPRAFHRYSRANIPGLRISEAVQGAFHQQNWWVELEIVTPGFFWTADSGTGLEGANRLRTSRSMDGLTAQATGQNDLRPVFAGRLASGYDHRFPETGNMQYNTMGFPLRLENAGSLGRIVNDWIQFDNLSIGANDRSRVGDVVVEVRLYNLGGIPGAIGGVGQWMHQAWFTEDGGATWTPHAYLTADNAFFVAAGLPNATPYWLIAGQGPTQTVFPNTAVQTAFFYTADAGNVAPPVGATGSIWTQTAEVDGLDVTRTFRVQYTYQPAGVVGDAGAWRFGDRGGSVWDDQLVVARFGEIGLEFLVHPDDDVEDHQLRSGARDWAFLNQVPVGETRPIGAILPEQSNWTNHQTVRAILRETAPGSLPATGAHPTVFHFHDDVQVLGVRMWTNDAHFSAGHNDSDDEVWFGHAGMEADNFLNASIQRNSVTIRPEIGFDEIRRWQLAEITVEFYISIRPGFEMLNGENINVTVNSGTVEAPFEDTLTVAYTWDPISVDTQLVVLDDNDVEAAMGIIRGINISDVVINETRSGELFVGQRIWLGLEGGISRNWGSADHMALRAGGVEIRGDSQLAVTPIHHDSHGSFVEIIRGSREDGAQIVFTDIQVSGRVVPDELYSIIVADTAAAHNWEGFAWLNAIQSDVGFTRGTVRGFFNEEPYVTPAFRFEGAEFYAPPTIPAQPTPPTPGPGDNQQQVQFPPVTLGEWMTSVNSVRNPGYTFQGTPIVLVPSVENPAFAVSYVMFSVIADLLGIEGVWDPATSSATFTDGTTTVVVTNGQTTALVNGNQVEIRAAGMLADARIINDRFFVPITFFRDQVPQFPVTLQWNDGAPGSRSVTVFPR